jgi:chromosome segregation ATPase
MAPLGAVLGGTEMNSTSPISHAVNDWLAVLMAAERAADAMRSEMDEQYHMLDDLERQSVEPTRLAETQSRINPGIRQLNDHVATAQRSAEHVAEEMATVENDLRHWVEKVAALRERLGMPAAI